MTVDLDTRIKLLLARGATQHEVKLALQEIDHKALVNARRYSHAQDTRPRQDDEIELMKRAGRLLHFFYHGFPGGNATDADRALCDLIKKAPRN